MYTETARDRRESQRRRVAKFWEDKRDKSKDAVKKDVVKCSECGTEELDQYGLLKCDCLPF